MWIERVLLAAGVTMIWIPLMQAAQAVSPDGAPFWPTLGVGGGIAALVIGMWRLDRNESQKRYADLAKESQDRYASLAKESQDRYTALAKESNERAAAIAADFRVIVQDNTKALTELSGKVSGISEADIVTVRLVIEALRKNKVLNVEP